MRKLSVKNPNPVFMTDDQGVIHYANPAAKRMIKKCQGESISHLPELFHDPLRSVLDARKRHFEINVEAKTYQFDAVQDLKQSKIFFFGADVTDRKRIERQLRENQSRYALAQKVSHVGAWDWEIKSGRILWRYRVDSIFGLKKTRLRYFKDTLKLVFPEDRERIVQNLNHNILKKNHYHFEHRVIWPDGSIHWLRQAGSVFRDPEKPERMIGIVLDITSRKRARQRLESEKTDLESLIRKRTRELKQLNVSLQREIQEREIYQQRLRLLSSELAMSEEKQRRLIASNLHDDIIQTLVYSNLRLGGLIEKSQNQDMMKSLQDVYGLNDQVIEKLRRVTFEISPPILYEFGLIAAVEWLGSQFKEQYGLKVKVNAQIKKIDMDEEIRLILYQAFRELFNNTVKHAQANRVHIDFELSEHDLEIRFTDDGIGFNLSQLDNKQATTSGFGIFNIKDRIKYLDGRFEIQSQPGSGATALIRVPLEKEI